jgi:hypothetical protein
MANGWSVANGVLINDPVQKEGTKVRFGNLRTEREFEDFNLKLEVNVPPGSNSGVYLRGRHEIQVMDSHGRSVNSHNMGALYSRIAPVSMPKNLPENGRQWTSPCANGT